MSMNVTSMSVSVAIRSQSAHAEAFGCVVPASKVGDAEFFGLMEGALAHFSRDEAVAADLSGFFNHVLCGAGAPADTMNFALLRTQNERFAL